MPRKTKKQKQQAATRRKNDTLATSSVKAAAPRKSIVEKPVYHETTYDKKLRKYTIQDTIRTLIITTLLFVMQYIVFTQSASIYALFQ